MVMPDLRRSLLLLLLGLFALAAALAALVFAVAGYYLLRQFFPQIQAIHVAQALLLALLLLLPLYVVCALWGYTVMVRSMVQPAERLLQRIKLAGLADTSEGLRQESSGGSFARLSHALSDLLESLTRERNQLRQTVTALEDAQQRLEQGRANMARAERLASVGRMAAGLAHEIGNPLGIASGYLQLLQGEGAEVEERRDYLVRARRELERIDALIRRLLLCTRGGGGRETWQPVSVTGQVQDLFDDLREMQPFKGVELRLDGRASRDIILCDPAQLRQVLLNCLLNAADALAALAPEAPRRITVTTDCLVDAVSGVQRLELAIADTGSGIPAEQLPLVFDPFFTSKEPGRGTGLGLSVCHAIVEDLGGDIFIESPPGQGACVRIVLPLRHEEG